MNLKETTCCFSGHRPMKLPWGMREGDPRCQKMKSWISEALEELYSSGYRRFICGMAIGCDMIFAEAVIALRQVHPDVILEGAVPCDDQASRWNKAQKQHYAELISSADVIKTFQPNYSGNCMQRRNEYMVDEASLLLACYDGRPGGTMKTILYAQRQGLEVRVLDVSSLSE